MNTLKKIATLLMIGFMLSSLDGFSQNKVVVVREKHANRKVVVTKKRHGLFSKRVTYHPVWAPKVSFTNRWVYFPRFNFYWDNYLNVYVIRAGSVWVTTATAPMEVKKVDLSNEKMVELSQENDSQESIQNKNDEHRIVYKVD